MQLPKYCFICFCAIICMIASGSANAADMNPKVDNFIFLYDASGSMDNNYAAQEEKKAVLAKTDMQTMRRNIPDLGYKAGLYTVAENFNADFPMAEFSNASYRKAIAGLKDDLREIGLDTPLASGIKHLDSILRNLSGKTAVILFSDGGENKGGDPARAVKQLSNQYDVCFHVVSYAQSEWEKKIIAEIVNSRDCSTHISAEAFQGEAARSDFIQNIFYTKASPAPKDSDGDGVADADDECPNTPAGAEVDENGCPIDSDNDGVADYRDECPNTPEGANVNNCGCWVVADLRFELNKTDIQPAYHDNLKHVVTVLQKNPEIKVEIQGHTDNQGSDAYNQKLSERRARAVRDFLAEAGIDKDRLCYEGYGESEPVASNENAEGRMKNRRVEIKPILH
ncbi:MAG: OmpA family protein [Desulfosalsimonadaceae bacterium]